MDWYAGFETEWKIYFRMAWFCDRITGAAHENDRWIL